MAGGARGRGGRGGSPPRKRARHDAEAGSSSRPAVEPWRSAQARQCGALSRSGGRGAWSRFNELGDQLWPTTKRLRDAEIEHHAAKEAVEAGEESAAERLEAAKEEYQLANILYRSACEYYLNVKP